MKILVIGGAGFIGTALCKTLIDRGHTVISYDLKRSNICSSIKADIRDAEALLKAIKKVNSVFHLAAISNTNYVRQNPNRAFQVNIEGTYIIARQCSKLNVPLHFASTICVYGNVKDHPSIEEHSCVPTDIYGATKVVGEQIVKRTPAYNILRLGTTYGPNMRQALAIHIFITQALKGDPLTIHGSGLQTRCMIYIDDLVEACAKVVDKQIIGETLNLATEEELSVLTIADMILEATQKPKKMVFVEDRVGQIMKEQISIKKAQKLLDWTPKVDFKTGLHKTLEWMKK